MGPPVEIRILERDELALVGEIDRTERIEVLFEQHGTELVASRGVWNAPAWNLDGHGEHSVSAQHETLLRYADVPAAAQTLEPRASAAAQFIAQ